MLKRTAALLAAGLLTLPACSGDDAADSPTTATSAASPAPTPPASSPAPTTEPHVTTTLQPATSTVPTPPPTASPTTATATTPSPSTSPALDDEAAIRAVIDGYYQTFRTCLQDIPNCSPDAFEEFATGSALESLSGQLRSWHREPPITVSEVRYEWFVVETFTNTDGAAAVTCERDLSVYWEGANPLPPEYFTELREWRLTDAEGNWRLAEYRQVEIQRDEEHDLCADLLAA